jgi:hypothetical protein
MSICIDAPRWRDGNKRQTAAGVVGKPNRPQGASLSSTLTGAMLVDYSGGGQIARARQSLRPRQATRPLPVEIAT